ncbi:MAG: hypothetical protein ACXAD7_27855 [Candidatus Kariarchaeaceae archaeon]
MRKTKIKLFITTLILIIFLQIVVNGIEGSNKEIISERFESGLPNNWNYAHPDLWSTSTDYVKEGLYSLKLDGSGGIEFEGIQIPIIGSDGSIESWVFPVGSNSKEPMLYLRTTKNDGTSILTINSGYGIRIYKDYAVLFRISDYSLINLTTVYLDDFIANQWWYMKLEAKGSSLRAWVSKDVKLEEPIIEYDILDDDEEYRYYSGYPALSGRANIGSNYPTYYDQLNISISSTTTTTVTTSSSAIFLTPGFTFVTLVAISSILLILKRKIKG